ncbi:MAG: hypothetical protein JNK15_16320 [Planctomycetes bacterium]|nr:hypothetical protein [Planctomycetota bacterium]
MAELPEHFGRCLRCCGNDAADVDVRVAIDDVLDPMRVAVRMRSAFGRGDRPEHRRLLDLLRHGLRVIDEVGGHDV